MNETNGKKVKIVGVLIEAVKKVRLVSMAFRMNGLTIIGGENASGKTSILNSIAAALGGEKLCPSSPIADGKKKAAVVVTLDNGLTVKRTWTEKGSYLSVKNRDGMRGGQNVLNDLLSPVALDVGKIIHMDPADRLKMLRRLCGVDTQPIEGEIRQMVSEREAQSRVLSRARAALASMPPEEAISPDVANMDELLDMQKTIRAAQEQGRALSMKLSKLESDRNVEEDRIRAGKRAIEALKADVARYKGNVHLLTTQIGEVERDIQQGAQSGELEEELTRIEEQMTGLQHVTRIQQDNARRKAAEVTLTREQGEYDSIDARITEKKAKLHKMIAESNMPDPDLSIVGNEITFKGKTWDCMSGAEQLWVSDRIARAVTPKAAFVLLDGLEAFDKRTLSRYCERLDKDGLQGICTVVTTSKSEADLIMEDGAAAYQSDEVAPVVDEEEGESEDEDDEEGLEDDFEGSMND